MLKTRNQASVQFSAGGDAKSWDRMYRAPKDTFELHMLKRRDLTERLVRARFAKSDKILDLGCGAGPLSESLLEAGYAPICADASADMLRLARERLERFNRPEASFVQADCTKLPFESGSFDLVVSLGMFGYFEETSEALAEIRRVLKPGGALLLSVRNLFHQVWTDPLPFVASRLKPKASAGGGANERSNVQAGRFRIPIFARPNRLIEGVSALGYDLEDFIGYGLGPMKVLGKNLLPEGVAMRFSDLTSSLIGAKPLSFAGRWLCDVSIYQFRSTAH
jgi:ubiquinone/menaquinone biosynthesis C-methylase UbiE